MFANHHRDDPRAEQLDYWLRRAEQESIAAIRSASGEAAQRHDAMALAYSTMAMSLLDERPAPGPRR